MKSKQSSEATWSAIRRSLQDHEPEALLSLIKDLHDLAPANRDFLQARVQPTPGDSATLGKYRKRVVEQFYPARGEGKLKLGESRRAIREYHKATGDIPGTIELLLVFCETGARFTNEFGDIHERFYDGLCAGLEELCAMVKKTGRFAWNDVSARLDKLEKATDGIGWGYHDHISECVYDLRKKFRSGRG